MILQNLKWKNDEYLLIKSHIKSRTLLQARKVYSVYKALQGLCKYGVENDTKQF